MTADEQMARDYGGDMFSAARLRQLEEAIDAALNCSRVAGTKLEDDLDAIRVRVREYRAQIVRAWD